VLRVRNHWVLENN